MNELYDVIVVGAGHAGIEAALAAARMGRRTLMVTMNLDGIGLMPCNPSIGGPAKGHVVREIDALGGEMARAIDDTFIHIRMLNTGKGPAVQALRAQADKAAYRLRMKKALERQPNLDLKQAMVDGLLVEPISCQPSAVSYQPSAEHSSLITHHSSLRVAGVVTNLGRRYLAKAVVLTTGTSLRGRVIVGDVAYTAGRSGEAAATELSGGLRDLGFELGRLKTGTPPRVDVRTIDFSKTEMLLGSAVPLHFSFRPDPNADRQPFPVPHPAYPLGEPTGWRPQMPCYLVHTGGETHRIIRENLHRAPMFNGLIEGTGTRYCPSIEDKIHSFPHKTSHQLFLEPEGWETGEVYVQGANTSLPEEVQLAMLRSIPALAHAELMRVGYAIEYDYVPPSQITAWLETKRVAGLFLAGQINGTSGYEEAAGQGILAGINAALAARGEQPLILERSRSYIGVMADDLVTRDVQEPYRLLTSRAEHRLLLRQDNADERLTPIGYRLGLIDRERYERTMGKYERVRREEEELRRTWLVPSAEFNRRLEELGMEPLSKGMPASSLLCRPEMSCEVLMDLLDRRAGVSLGLAHATCALPPSPVDGNDGAHDGRAEPAEAVDATPDRRGMPAEADEAACWAAGGAQVPALRTGGAALRAGDDTPPRVGEGQGEMPVPLSPQSSVLSPDVVEQVEIRIRYEAYIKKQEAQAERTVGLEHLPIPDRLEYDQVAGLRNEAREKLLRFRPATVGMASRINGVTAADVAVLLVALEKLRRNRQNHGAAERPPGT